MAYGFNEDRSKHDLSDVVRTADIADVLRDGDVSLEEARLYATSAQTIPANSNAVIDFYRVTDYSNGEYTYEPLNINHVIGIKSLRINTASAAANRNLVPLDWTCRLDNNNRFCLTMTVWNKGSNSISVRPYSDTTTGSPSVDVGLVNV